MNFKMMRLSHLSHRKKVFEIRGWGFEKFCLLGFYALRCLLYAGGVDISYFDIAFCPRCAGFSVSGFGDSQQPGRGNRSKSYQFADLFL